MGANAKRRKGGKDRVVPQQQQQLAEEEDLKRKSTDLTRKLDAVNATLKTAAEDQLSPYERQLWNNMLKDERVARWNIIFFKDSKTLKKPTTYKDVTAWLHEVVRSPNPDNEKDRGETRKLFCTIGPFLTAYPSMGGEGYIQDKDRDAGLLYKGSYSLDLMTTGTFPSRINASNQRRVEASSLECMDRVNATIDAVFRLAIRAGLWRVVRQKAVKMVDNMWKMMNKEKESEEDEAKYQEEVLKLCVEDLRESHKWGLERIAEKGLRMYWPAFVSQYGQSRRSKDRLLDIRDRREKDPELLSEFDMLVDKAARLPGKEARYHSQLPVYQKDGTEIPYDMEEEPVPKNSLVEVKVLWKITNNPYKGDDAIEKFRLKMVPCSTTVICGGEGSGEAPPETAVGNYDYVDEPPKKLAITDGGGDADQQHPDASLSCYADADPDDGSVTYDQHDLLGTA